MSETLSRLAVVTASMSTLSSTAFYASIFSKLDKSVSESIQTAATDCFSKIIFNESFANKQSDEEFVGLCLHELFHIIFKHGSRRLERDPDVWNYACDYVINADILGDGFKLPRGALHEPKYKGMTAEDVYDDLMANPSNIPAADSVEHWLDMHEPIDEDGQPIESSDLESAIDGILLASAQECIMQGNEVPSSMQRLLEAITEPVIDWRLALNRFAYQNLMETDYSFQHPHKISNDIGILIPTILEEETADSIMLAVDVSGSVSKTELTKFIGECVGIFKAVNPKDVTVVLFDHTIELEQKVNNAEELVNIPYVGGGGTDVEPVFKLFERSNCNGLVFFTDGYFMQQRSHFDKPLLWAVYDNNGFTSPIGEVVKFKSKNL